MRTTAAAMLYITDRASHCSL